MADSRHFASDNFAGVHPAVLAAIADENSGHDISYGDDSATSRLNEIVAKKFGSDIEAFPVFNGTAANVIALQSLLPRWGAVISADTAHINVDEGGAPERVAGIKILTVAGVDGKITPQLIEKEAWGYGDVHRAQPSAVSISQSTELGTVYTPKEITEIVETAHKHGILVHVDGSRIGNAAAHLSLTLRETTFDLGIDALSLGGTKNGALAAEAVLLRKDDTLKDPQPIEYLRKTNMQLASKMRFISAQLIALYEEDLWLKNASHANKMATLLKVKLQKAGFKVTRPVDSNAVFVNIESKIAEKASESFLFYPWPASINEYRLMCSFDTSEEDVNALVAKLVKAAR